MLPRIYFPMMGKMLAEGDFTKSATDFQTGKGRLQTQCVARSARKNPSLVACRRQKQPKSASRFPAD